jgi:hypothetical protein
MANVSFPDMVDLYNDFIDALDGFPPDFKVEGKGKTELETERDAYAAKYAEQRSLKRQQRVATGELKELRRIGLKTLVDFRRQAMIRFGTTEGLPIMPGAGSSGSVTEEESGSETSQQ